ncbi:MAG: hypothetical protein ABIR96_11310 [Bdellovibrionota bacterium]
MMNLDRIIANKKTSVDDAYRKDALHEAQDNHCSALASKQLGVESINDFNLVKAEWDRVYGDLMKKAERGELDASVRAEIEQTYKSLLSMQQERLEGVHDAEQTPENIKAARALRTKLSASNTLSFGEITQLGHVLASGGNPTYGGTFLSWEYDTEKDARSGEEFFVAYQAMYTGTSCMGYNNIGRVTAVPSFKLPMKYFDREKIGAWIKNAYRPGYATWNMGSIPMKFAALGSLCPLKVKGMSSEKVSSPQSSKRH